jgi:hypothetical protein
MRTFILVAAIKRGQFLVTDEFAAPGSSHAPSHRGALFVGQAKNIAAPALDLFDRLFDLSKYLVGQGSESL